jgi:hypothetical protein
MKFITHASCNIEAGPLMGKFVILRYDKILYTEYAKRRRENLAKLQAKNLPNLFWPRNPPNCRSSVEQQKCRSLNPKDTKLGCILIPSK